MKVEVRPLNIPKWHGHTGKESFTRPKTLNVLVDSETRQYATGLNYVDKTFSNPDNPKEKMTEAEYYGKILKADLSPQYFEEITHPFWDSKTPKIKLENKTMFFDSDNPIDYIKIKIMKASKFVANSIREWEEGHYPDATHVITDEAEEAEVKASKVQLKNKAIIKLEEASIDRKIQLVLIIGGKNLRGASNNTVTVEVDKLVETKAPEVVRYLDMDKEQLAINALVIEALQRNILKKNGHKIMYYDSYIGDDIDATISYLQQEENQDLKMRIMEQIGK